MHRAVTLIAANCCGVGFNVIGSFVSDPSNHVVRHLTVRKLAKCEGVVAFELLPTNPVWVLAEMVFSDGIVG